MILVLSPAKTLDESPASGTVPHSPPEFLDDAQTLVDELAKMSAPEIGRLMSVSDKLAELNFRRYREWSRPFTEENARQALLAFRGDVYTGFDFANWNTRDFNHAQKTIRILSGLYGILRPLDLMQAYRLEMGTRMANPRGKDLYEFWGERITEALNQELAGHKGRSRVLVNLASIEYFKAVRTEGIDVPVISPVFKDEKKGVYRIISFYAKKARGMMADFIVRNRIADPADLQGFNLAGYRFDEVNSTEAQPVFLRDEEVARAVAAAA